MMYESPLTAIDVLANAVWHFASISCRNSLGLQAATRSAHTPLSIIHGLLERVVLPSEHIISVLAVTGGVSGA